MDTREQDKREFRISNDFIRTYNVVVLAYSEEEALAKVDQMLRDEQSLLSPGSWCKPRVELESFYASSDVPICEDDWLIGDEACI